MSSDINEICILDFGVGNISSLARMFEHLSIPSKVISTSSEILASSKLVIPGVGHFGYAMNELRRRDLIGALNEAAMEARIPILGVCLGMQLLSKSSEEGDAEGLGWIDARTIRFNFDKGEKLPVPNMGWRRVVPCNPSPLFPDSIAAWRFYFVHSYHVHCLNSSHILAQAHYGYGFVAAMGASNIFGVQFHPEKSHRYGMALLSSFAESGSNE